MKKIITFVKSFFKIIYHFIIGLFKRSTKNDSGFKQLTNIKRLDYGPKK